jgi:hypothetical protein
MLMSKKNQVARIYFMPNGFRVLVSGDHVLCAVSKERIDLEDLRYWSADRQEAYSSAANASLALMPKGR